MINHRKSLEDAYQDIACFMYGLHWWKDETIKHKVYIEKHFLKFENLKHVWQKMSDNYKNEGRLLTTTKEFYEIFEDVADGISDFCFRDKITLEEMLCLSTSEKLKTINK